MGEHKYNPTAIAAKEGKLPPKKIPDTSPAETKRWLQEMIYNECVKLIDPERKIIRRY